MNRKEFENLFLNKISDAEKIAMCNADGSMNENEWENFNNFMSNLDYDVNLLINTFCNFVIVLPHYSNEQIGDKPKLVLSFADFTSTRLLNYCADITEDREMRLPKTVKELAEWTEDLYHELTNTKGQFGINPFHIYMNQNNDKFMCLIRIWDKAHWM